VVAGLYCVAPSAAVAFQACFSLTWWQPLYCILHLRSTRGTQVQHCARLVCSRSHTGALCDFCQRLTSLESHRRLDIGAHVTSRQNACLPGVVAYSIVYRCWGPCRPNSWLSAMSMSCWLDTPLLRAHGWLSSCSSLRSAPYMLHKQCTACRPLSVPHCQVCQPP
jgi:hypothetical protein